MDNNKKIALRKEFIIKNPSSLVSVFWLNDMLMKSQIPVEEAFMLFNALDQHKLVNLFIFKEVKARLQVAAVSDTAISHAISPKESDDIENKDKH